MGDNASTEGLDAGTRHLVPPHRHLTTAHIQRHLLSSEHDVCIHRRNLLSSQNTTTQNARTFPADSSQKLQSQPSHTALNEQL
jgi:hypothetical protein